MGLYLLNYTFSNLVICSGSFLSIPTTAILVCSINFFKPFFSFKVYGGVRRGHQTCRARAAGLVSQELCPLQKPCVSSLQLLC